MRIPSRNASTLGVWTTLLVSHPILGILPAGCASAASGAAKAPASEVSSKRRRSMAGWWGGSAGDVKCVAFVSTAGGPRTALAVEPDDQPIDAGVHVAALTVLGVEGVESRPTSSAGGAVGRVGFTTSPLPRSRSDFRNVS